MLASAASTLLPAAPPPAPAVASDTTQPAPPCCRWPHSRPLARFLPCHGQLSELSHCHHLSLGRPWDLLCRRRYLPRGQAPELFPCRCCFPHSRPPELLDFGSSVMLASETAPWTFDLWTFVLLTPEVILNCSLCSSVFCGHFVLVSTASITVSRNYFMWAFCTVVHHFETLISYFRLFPYLQGVTTVDHLACFDCQGFTPLYAILDAIDYQTVIH